MPENEKPVNIHWLVRVAGCDEELLVYAAYVQYHDASVPTKTTLRTASDAGRPASDNRENCWEARAT